MTSSIHLHFHPEAPETLAAGAARFRDWLRTSALPTWVTLGRSEDGAFFETLKQDGRSVASSRRARVQARQIYVYAQAGKMGWQGPWRRAVATGLERLHADYRRPDGQCRTLLAADGTPLDETAMVYDQAFVMFALAAAKETGAEPGAWGDLSEAAAVIRDRLMAGAGPNGALVEAGADPYQSNCHMHLLEAAMAWEALSDDPKWGTLADQLTMLADSSFIDAEGGFLREFFGPDWMPAEGDTGRLVEPGHQFEWAWLMARRARSRGDEAAFKIARKLFAYGLKGVDQARGIALDALNDDGTIRNNRARLWPQTEWLKASLILAELTEDGEQRRHLEQAGAAMRALWIYLTPEGLWRDKNLPDRSFIDEPAPASSFYHIISAFGQAAETVKNGDVEGLTSLTLD